MQNANVTNPNDFKVVEFCNSTDFDFLPDMGCMYDGRPISGKSGKVGILSGETVMLPYHVGSLLATNLAKQAMLRAAPEVDKAGIPTGVPMWSDTTLESRRSSYVKELYSEERAAPQSQTDLLMAKVDEYKKTVDQLLSDRNAVKAPDAQVDSQVDTSENGSTKPADGVSFMDKSEVIAELEKRGIVHDKRKGKAELEKLLA